MHMYLEEQFGQYLLKVPRLLLIGLGFSVLAAMGILALFEGEIPLVVYSFYLLFVVPAFGGLAFAISIAIKRKNYAALAIAISMIIGAMMAIYHIECGFGHFIFPVLLPTLLINFVYWILRLM